jgi:hypothetical protein
VQRLADLDKFVLFDALRDDLTAVVSEESSEAKLIRERQEVLEAMRAVAEHLQLPLGEAPTGVQFSETCKELGLPWSKGKAIGAWERWNMAVEAFKGERRIETPRQRLQRQTAYRASGQDDCFRGVRLWLQSEPPVTTIDAYDNFAKRHNENVKDPSDRVALRSALRRTLSLKWPQTLAVARGEMTLEEAINEALATELPRARKGGLMGVPAIARFLRSNQNTVQRAADGGDKRFPIPVARISGQRAWLYEDIHRYKRSYAVPKRQEDEQQHLFMDKEELATRLEIAPKSLMGKVNSHRWELVPPPEGFTSVGCPYWRRAKAEHWLKGQEIK